ncbi:MULTISPECIES: methyltransferase family protein [Burkholderia]|jgi:protein-S-isoprenylcysteine O-methyltransferase|uniref:Isoprenylcysteine carboxylmethyltransferase family protein n=1 Tax=Burkholderia contaminans TaxID=488447 RepID=A0A1E3FS04_9BURK|nr:MULTISPECIES: isoprenylcysteine carboxylmethyltransferase family protein [Burkholderia]UTP27166.1 isoprenylcysteine carboxylmethyltransferase family protein [Burkholderia sp. FXe9]HBN6128705.1 isoprenylcysteine carboxylmethyltransferase family protein [Clostridioides difficile]MBA9832899.1 isoprenylcysteine carboxylmethyltransferase family protein [Burkholderia contaminans]MBA9841153.1 isoprenylcysteine carboxylmethyltransferase family protein [Burkholderia contaminans]MBA9866485.1 isopreny
MKALNQIGTIIQSHVRIVLVLGASGYLLSQRGWPVRGDVAWLIFTVWYLAEALMERRHVSAPRQFQDRGSRQVLVLARDLSLLIPFLIAVFGDMPEGAIGTAMAGLISYVAGLLLRLNAMSTLNQYFTMKLTVAPGHRLVDHGPYRFVRHPGYLGLILILSAPSMLYPGSMLLALAVVVFVGAATCYRVVLEERMLMTAIGPSYGVYRQSVDCIVPIRIVRKCLALLRNLFAGHRT